MAHGALAASRNRAAARRAAKPASAPSRAMSRRRDGVARARLPRKARRAAAWPCPASAAGLRARGAVRRARACGRRMKDRVVPGVAVPREAQSVQYVKICSLYGAGFYYIPGTDMCLKVGGWTRFEAAYETNNSSTATWAGDINAKSTNNLWYRVRGYITVDAREQTAYGTARAYMAVGLSTASVA